MSNNTNISLNLKKLSPIMSSVKFQTSLMNLQNNLLNFAYMLTSNREDAHELLQDTTLKALDNEDKYSSSTNLKGWLFTIMRNVFINKYRNVQHAAAVIDDTEEIYLLNISASAAVEAPEDTYSVDSVTSAIHGLAEEFRIPYSMHVAGYHHSEIAEHLNISVSEVKTRIRFAHKQVTLMQR